jgi:aspartate dehydrogenase
MEEIFNGRPVERRVAIAGLGSIGIKLVQALDTGIDGFVLAAVSARDPGKHEGMLAKLNKRPAFLSIDALSAAADIVIECAPSNLLSSIVAPFLSKGKTAIILSAGALLEHGELIQLAKQNGGQIIVPTGALIGLDAVTAAAEGRIRSVRMITRKPVKGLLGAPYLVENGIHIESISQPLKIFEGTAREAARGFPANLNVAVALSLAGIGPDLTTLEIWADPALQRNTHRIEVDSDSASFSMSIENVPSDNPKTGLITALSVISFLRKQRSAIRVGS